MIKVGEKVRFDPYHSIHATGVAAIQGEVTGKVILVHHKHRYFTAEYEVEGEKFKISFKFDDVFGPDRFVYFVKE